MAPSKPKRGSKKAAWIAAAVFIVLLAVPISFGIFFYKNATELSANAINNRKTLVGITATAISVKLDRLVGIATTMMSNPAVVKEVSESDWTEASGALRDLQNNVDFYDPYIDRVVLFSSTGTEVAAYPELSGGIGTNAASSSWYNAIANGAPSYVSTVTKRISQPQLNVISIAAPIVSNNTIVGYGVLQIPTTNFLEFGSDVSLGTFGFVFIVDPQGNIVAHPRYSSGDESIINLSSDPVVKAALEGNAGTSEVFSPVDDETIVSTYSQVPTYGWGVVAEEPYNEIFSGSNSIFLAMESLIIIFLLIDMGISYLVFKFLNRNHEK